MSKCFDGNMSDKECIDILQISRNTYYKYKKECKRPIRGCIEISGCCM